MKSPATITLTLEKALTDTFILALQQELQGAVVVTAVENFNNIKLPACFVKCTRQTESIINSGIFQFNVDIALLVQSDDMDAQRIENLWSNILNVCYDIENLKNNLNSIRPQYAYVFGVLRNGSVSLSTSERHFERSVSILVHAALYQPTS